MDFKAWWYSIPVNDRAAVAARVEASEGYLNMVAGRFRQAGESLAIRIEEESAGQVTVEELRPDVPWHVVRGKPCPVGDGSPAEKAA